MLAGIRYQGKWAEGSQDPLPLVVTRGELVGISYHMLPTEYFRQR